MLEGSSRSVPGKWGQLMASKTYVLVLLSFICIFVLSRSFMFANWEPKVQISSIIVVPSQSIVADHQERTRNSSDTVNDPSRVSCKSSAVLKVYMYDLPAEFHFGMIQKMQEGQIWPKDLNSIPRYPGGLYQQHSPEYWLTIDLLTSVMPDRSNQCTAVRIFEEKAADIFWVPFFSSLSYNKYSSRSKGKENDELQLRLVKFLKSQKAWKRHEGRDHVIMMHHPNSLHVARRLLKKAMFVVADFGRYPTEVANVHKDIVAPYKHVVPTLVDDDTSFDSRGTLLYFQGAIVRKEGGAIRRKLYEMLKNEEGVHFTTGNTKSNGIRSATRGMRSSKFCLHLAGDTPSSNRLFDAIASHCVPVIISDDIELPFKEELEYRSFCLFVESKRALKSGHVIELLRGYGEKKWRKMFEKLKEVHRHFEYVFPSVHEDAVHMTWKAISTRLASLRSQKILVSKT